MGCFVLPSRSSLGCGNRLPLRSADARSSDDAIAFKGTTHLYYKGTPVYPFGWGKSYTDFEFAFVADEAGVVADGSRGFRSRSGPGSVEQRVSATGMAVGKDTIKHVVAVTNVGSAASSVSVQAYISSNHSDAVHNSALYAFNKTGVLQPGETEHLLFVLPANRLALVNDDGDRYLAPGDYTIKIGGAGSSSSSSGSSTPLGADFVTGKVVVEGEARFLWQLTGARRRWEEGMPSAPFSKRD